MRRFSKLYEVNKTRVKIIGDEKWYLVKEISDNCYHIKIADYVGSFQRGHIIKFTNKSDYS